MEEKEIRKRLYAFRNGIAADAMRRAGYPHKVILGVEIPRIAGIARQCGGTDDTLAESLWADTDMREARILATYLFDPEKCDMERALQLAASVLTREEADMLAFRLFRRLSFAAELAARLEADGGENEQMAARALRAHIG